MKTPGDRTPERRLLEAVLSEGSWQAGSASFKNQALGAYRARQRVRQAGRAACLAGMVLCAVGASYWAGWPVSRSPGSESQAGFGEAAAKPARFMSDAELVASFPAGSCFLAEIDGRLQLVFNDPATEQQYLERTP